MQYPFPYGMPMYPLAMPQAAHPPPAFPPTASADPRYSQGHAPQSYPGFMPMMHPQAAAMMQSWMAAAMSASAPIQAPPVQQRPRPATPHASTGTRPLMPLRPAAKPSDSNKGLQKLASEGAFNCQPCDRGFDTEKDLRSHLDTHESCNHRLDDGTLCTFAASRRILSEHQSRAHRKANSSTHIPSSLLELVPPRYRYAHKLGDSPDDIAKWREERRKKYPTVDRAAAKEAARAEWQAKGALLEGNPAKRPRIASPDNRNQAATAKSVEAEAVIESEPPQKDEETDDGEPEEFPVTTATDLPLTAAIPDTSSHNDAQKPTTTTSASDDHKVDLAAYKPHKPLCRMFVRGKCRAGDGCRYSHDPTDRAAVIKRSNDNKHNRKAAGPSICQNFIHGTCTRGAGCKYSHGAAEVDPIRSNLLRKLLDSDIKRETSAMLQCIRYVVSRNFLQPTSLSEHKSAADSSLG